MARPARGHEFVDAAITQAAQAKTISELRMAQALLLPLKFGLSLDDTSVAVGRSKSWTLSGYGSALAAFKAAGTAQLQTGATEPGTMTPWKRRRPSWPPCLSRPKRGA